MKNIFFEIIKNQKSFLVHKKSASKVLNFENCAFISRRFQNHHFSGFSILINFNAIFKGGK